MDFCTPGHFAGGTDGAEFTDGMKVNRLILDLIDNTI